MEKRLEDRDRGRVRADHRESRLSAGLHRDRGRTRNTVRALALRVGFSIALFLLILAAHYLGWIQSTGVPVGVR
jgi:hypothetical protein